MYRFLKRGVVRKAFNVIVGCQLHALIIVYPLRYVEDKQKKWNRKIWDQFRRIDPRYETLSRIGLLLFTDNTWDFRRLFFEIWCIILIALLKNYWYRAIQSQFKCNLTDLGRLYQTFMRIFIALKILEYRLFVWTRQVSAFPTNKNYNFDFLTVVKVSRQ